MFSHRPCAKVSVVASFDASKLIAGGVRWFRRTFRSRFKCFCLVHFCTLHGFNMPSTVMLRLSLWTLLGCISDTGWWARGAPDLMICGDSITGAHWWTLTSSIESSWKFPQAGMSGAMIFASWSWNEEGSDWYDDSFRFWKEPSNTSMQDFTNSISKASANVTENIGFRMIQRSLASLQQDPFLQSLRVVSGCKTKSSDGAD